MVYHSDEILLDIGFSLTGQLPMHSVYWNFDTIKIVLSFYKATFPIFKNGAHFSVTSIALKDVNVRGGNVIKPFAREIGSGQKFVSLLQIKGNESENYGYVIHACLMFNLENTACLSTFVKMSLNNSEENICSVY